MADNQNTNNLDQADSLSLERQEVDIDKLSVKVLILCQNRSRLDNVASFLNRRGWEAVVVSKIEETIKILASDKPDFVMISMNHSNKKVAVLPTFMTQTFNAKCIVFGELSDSKTIGSIHASKAQYKMMGSVSGPSVHRKIKQILNDIYNKKPETDSNSGFNSLSQDETQTISGNNSSATGMQRFSQNSSASHLAAPSSAAEQALQMASGAIDSNSNNDPGSYYATQGETTGMNNNPSSNDSASGFQNNSHHQSKLPVDQRKGFSKSESSNTLETNKSNQSNLGFSKGNTNYDPFSEQEGVGSECHIDSQLTSNKKPGFSAAANSGAEIPKEPDQQNTIDSSSHPEFSNSKTKAETAVSSEAASSKSFSKPNTLSASFKKEEHYSEKPEKGNKKAQAKSSFSNSNQKPGLSNNSLQPNDNAFDSFENCEEQESKTRPDGRFLPKLAKSNRERAKYQGNEFKNSLKPELDENKDELFNAISKSMESICKEAEEFVCPVTKVEVVYIVPVKGDKNTGFLLLGASDVIANEEEFLNSFQRQIEKQLNLGEADYIVDKTVKCKIEEVSFYDFCKKSGDFTVVEISGDLELCVTFVPFTNPIPEIKQKLGHVKSEIDVSTLPLNKEITFNTYLHLKKNKKYFMFLKNGNFFLQNQKERLTNKKVPLYISREDQDEYKYFYMRNHVQDFIVEFIASNKLNQLAS